MKVISFAPFAQISQHEGPTKVVAEALMQSGAEVVTVRCNTTLAPGCLVLQSQSSLDQQKRNRVCNECKTKARFSDKKSGTQVIYLEDFLNLSDQSAIADETERITPSNAMGRLFRGIPVARFSMFELSLNFKLMPEAPIPKAYWENYIEIYRAALLVACAMDRILDHEKPDRLVTYNSRYSANRVACWLSDSRRIPNFSLHAGAHHVRRYQQLTIEADIGEHYFLNRSTQWQNLESRALTVAEVTRVWRHLEWILKAKSYWTYSSPLKSKPVSEVQQALGLSGGSGFALALMSSMDERGAWEYAKKTEVSDGGSLFADQWEWLSFLIKHFEANPDKTLVIRPHPREYPNKREKVTSQASQYIEDLAQKNTAANIVFNFPGDELSLYDLLKASSFVLNSSSSSGLEAVLFGKYVVGNGDVLTAYPPGIHAQPTSLEDYAELIREAAHEESRFIDVRRAYRWLSFLTGSFPIDISRYFDWQPARQRTQKVARDLLVYAEKKEGFPFLKRLAARVSAGFFFLLTRRRKVIDDRTVGQIATKILDNTSEFPIWKEHRQSRLALILETIAITAALRRLRNQLQIEKGKNFRRNWPIVMGPGS